ncbi:MAG: hypothetical protein ASARMPREDX12_001123 [Alectoria sarmentosa]|nr:MAG: hypothetical protein ASARMPREDX12_001123 [Alectoria sarmentosa]
MNQSTVDSRSQESPTNHTPSHTPTSETLPVQKSISIDNAARCPTANVRFGSGKIVPGSYRDIDTEDPPMCYFEIQPDEPKGADIIKITGRMGKGAGDREDCSSTDNRAVTMKYVGDKVCAVWKNEDDNIDD